MNTSVTAESGESATQRPDQRLGQKYRFDDPNMDLFFVAALGWGPAGGLDIGQAFYVASTIKDGDADSWIASFRSAWQFAPPGPVFVSLVSRQRTAFAAAVRPIPTSFWNRLRRGTATSDRLARTLCYWIARAVRTAMFRPIIDCAWFRNAAGGSTRPSRADGCVADIASAVWRIRMPYWRPCPSPRQNSCT